MKKFLSLVLAVLMLTSLAVSTSAVKILNSEGTGFIKTSDDDRVTMEDLHDIYGLFGPEIPYGGAFIYHGETIYTWWYDSCPKCDGLAFHYVSDGAIKWKCLEPDCGRTGTIEVPGHHHEESDVRCPECRSKKTLFLETVVSSNGELRDRYYCTNCHEFFYKNTTSIDDGFSQHTPSIECAHCGRTADFDRYYSVGGKLYARYICPKGHVNDRRVYSNIDFDPDEFRVRVVCSRGGDYEISGGRDAYYGEKKTIEFYPDYGYVLTEVYVNGKPVDVTKKLDLTVKQDTVVYAYFEKISSLKNFTITADADGNGRITARKNGDTVSPDEIRAKYSDTVTYKFVPASKNYYVESIRVDGKYVGHANSYTFSKVQDDHDLKVVFAWDNPYEDLAEKYERQVEYVTEAGIMNGFEDQHRRLYFKGTDNVSVKTFAATLAEMADTADNLDTTTERIDWAIAHDMITRDELNDTCDVRTACYMVRAYLEALEEINDISFVKLDHRDTVKESSIAIDLVTAKTYDKNRDLTRYDLAAVCYLLAGLAYED